MDPIVLEGRAASLGGELPVRRVLPQARARQLGPFVFLDHFGPHRFAAGAGIDVRPHPHIGLSTLTWLFEGSLLHRDSLGVVQEIRPGEVNWMSAGRGIVHSERTPPAVRAAPHAVHGLQLWVAAPASHEDAAPAFQHLGAAEVPAVRFDDARGHVVAGTAFGASSPLRVDSPTTLVVATLPAGGRFRLPAANGAHGVYLVEGELAFGPATPPLVPGSLVLLPAGTAVEATTAGGARFAWLGGAEVGERHLVWNFVASTPGRIAQARADWSAGRFPPVPGETEWIPLPEGPGA